MMSKSSSQLGQPIKVFIMQCTRPEEKSLKKQPLAICSGSRKLVEQWLFSSLLTTCFPATGLTATHVRAGWLFDLSLAAKRARLLITYLAATKDLSMMRAEPTEVI